MTTQQTHDELAWWAGTLGLRVHGEDTGPNGQDDRLVIDGTVAVEFRSVQPAVVVEWGDGYRGEFPRSLPSDALIGLVAGLLGYPRPALKEAAR